jgi:hypothetical protein
LKPDYIPFFRELVADFWEGIYQSDENERGFESNKRGKFFGVDQEMLSRCLWPLVIDNHLAHVQDYPQLKFTGREKIIAPPNRKQGETNLTAEPYAGMVCTLEPEYENYQY